MSGSRTSENNNRCSRMATTVTPENAFRVKSLIKKGPKMTNTEIQNIMKISSGSLTRILHDCLCVKKRCARRYPHSLSEEQKRDRVEWWGHRQRQFDRGRTPCVRDIAKGDDTWVYTKTTPRWSCPCFSLRSWKAKIIFAVTHSQLGSGKWKFGAMLGHIIVIRIIVDG